MSVFKFHLFQVVRHIKTDTVYRIHGTPDMLFIHKDMVPAYLYQDPVTMNLYVRPKEEMEKRFEAVKDV